MNGDELRAIQAPLKQQYRDNPSSAKVVMHASGTIQASEIACAVETLAGTVTAGLHPAAGGSGATACSGDMLLQALVACSGVTFAAVATAMGIEIRSASLHASAEMDFRGTLGVDRATPIGITSVQLEFTIDSPAEEAQLTKLIDLTERYCVVLQTLAHPASLTTSLRRINL